MVRIPSQDVTAFQGLTGQDYMCHAIRQGQTGHLVTDRHRLKQGNVIAPMLFNNFSGQHMQVY